MVVSLMDARANQPLSRNRSQPRWLTLFVIVTGLLFIDAFAGSRGEATADRMLANVLPVEERVELSYDAAAGELLAPVGPAASPVLPGVRRIEMEVTAYCACPKCCGPNAMGITASGKPVSHNHGRFVAADTRLLPFGTRLSIPGYHGGIEVEVIDRGGAIKGNKLDVFFPSHEQAKQWGRQRLLVTVFP